MRPEIPGMLLDMRTARETKATEYDADSVIEMRKFKANDPGEFQSQLVGLEREYQRTLQHYYKTRPKKPKKISEAVKDENSEKCIEMAERLIKELTK